MQNYAEKAENGNIFSQIADFSAKRRENLTNAQVKKIANTRNPDTNMDEVVFWVKVVMWFATAFCAYCGFLFYRESFGTSFSPKIAVLFSIGLALLVEVCKVFLSGRVIRSIFLGWFFSTWTKFGLWFFVAALAIGSFFWSYSISTDGLQIFSKMQQKRNAAPTLSLIEYQAAATSEIDKQIGALQEAQNKSLQSKWKGTIVHEAQKTATKNSTAIGKLQDQRAAVIASATDDYNVRANNAQEEIDTWAKWVAEYGGYMEIVCFLALITIGFAERELVDMTLKGDQTTPTPPNNGTKPQPRPEYLNLGERKPLFGNNQTVSQNNTVLQPAQAVTQHNSGTVMEGIDDTLNLARKALNSEIWNLQNGNGLPGTISKRVYSVFNRVGAALTGKARPDKNTFLAYYSAVEKVVDEMEAKGQRYEYTNEMYQQLQKFLPLEEAA